MTSDLDLPLLPSAEQIRRREFATVRRGYDPDQVRDYLGQVATQVETLEKDLRETKLRTDPKAAMSPGEALATKVAEEDTALAAQPPAPPQALPAAPAHDDAYERLSARFATMIEAADREATKIVDEAKAEAQRLLSEARTEADRIRVDAQARAEEARQRGSEELAKAKEEADRILGSLATRREALVTQMHDMQTKLLAVAHDLDVSMQERDQTGRSSSAPTPTPAATPAPSGSAEPVTSATQPSASSTSAPKVVPEAEPEATAGTKPEAKQEPPRGFDDDLVDPRYEDLWASNDTGSVDIPDLATIDVDFDDDTRKD
ncbi:MAG: DivIVA domain-containing protein [Planctomycetaceae bacterium]